MDRPVIWRMIKEAVENINTPASYLEIKEYINAKWADVNSTTITAQIIVMTVNHSSRIHYPENHKPRLSNSSSPYDLFFTIGRGLIVKYSVEEHGIWEIYKNGNDKLGIRLFKGDSLVNTYLFVWNPNKWNWTTLEQNIEQLKNGEKVTEQWSCSSYKAIKPGDRAFLVRVGSEPRGIFATGYIASEPFFSEFRSGEDKPVPRMRVKLDFDVLLNPEKDPILTLDILNLGNLTKQQWTPQSSGISVRPELVDELEAVWFDFLTTQNIRYNPFLETTDTTKTYIEGSATQIIQTRYERNFYARKECLKHYGYSCSVCDFNFERFYGSLGYKFIHVHHLTQIASIKQEYKINPIQDLRPVCPNCHSMLHKQNPPLTIEKLKEVIKMLNTK